MLASSTTLFVNEICDIARVVVVFDVEERSKLQQSLETSFLAKFSNDKNKLVKSTCKEIKKR
jgi:hypothetical protein